MRRFLFSSAFACVSIFVSFFALPSSALAYFAPGETLDPGCAPTTASCTVYQVNASTTGNFGVSTTSPWGLFSINPSGISGPSFAVGSSTQTSFIITNGGSVGIGTTSPSSTLTIGNDASGVISRLNGGAFSYAGVVLTRKIPNLFSFTSTDASAIYSAGYFEGVNNSSILNGSMSGLTVTAYSPAANSTNLNLVTGGNYNVSHNGSGTLNFLDALRSTVSQGSGAGAITTMAGIGNNFTVTGTVTNLYGLSTSLTALSNGGTITNTYGVYVGDITAGTQTSTPYSFYASDANAHNYFAGNVGIGTTSPGQKLSVAGDILGNNIIGSYFTGTSTATSTLTGGFAASILSVSSTTASSTFANGINLTAGCFAINGSCISGGGGGSGTVSSGTTNNLAYYTGATTVSSANTLTWDSGNGRLGVGTSTPAASLEVNNTFVFTTEYNNGDSGAAKTITWSNGNYQKVTLTEATTFTFVAPLGRGQYQLRIVMDGVGGYNITWPAAVKWPAGTKPTQTIFAGTSDIIGFFFDGTNYYNNYTMLDVR